MDDAGIVDTDGDGIREIDGENINLRYISYENRLLNEFLMHTQYLTEIGIGVAEGRVLMSQWVSWLHWIMILTTTTGLP